MKVHFWGVRGSLPTPITPAQVQAKIVAAIERITPKDIESEDAKTRFIASLPPWLFGTVGGNTPCIEVVTSSGKQFLLDCGSGLREFGVNGRKPEDNHYTIFMSHFHYDHIQGLPFFGPIYNPNAKIDFYTTFPAAEKIIAGQSICPYLPLNCTWENVKKPFTFHLMHELEPIYIDGVKITCKKMKHPGNSYSFSFEENGKKFIFATDVELQDKDYDRSIEENHFFENADVLVLDSQYTGEEAIAKANWGHSIFCYAVDFANVWNVKKLFFFHHEPTYSDKKIYSILRAAKWYEDYSAKYDVDLNIAVEGQEIEI
ncbi:MAG TPA: MBL fold metallo-hydrolase [Treponema sp.]|nr:MBL fold metallo-hydrolase [Treponema sp.]